MSATADMRALVDRIVTFVAGRGDRWEQEGSPERLLLNAASMLTGVADGMDAAGIDLEVVP